MKDESCSDEMHLFFMILHNRTFIFLACPLHDPVHICFLRRIYIPLRRPFKPSSTSSSAEEGGFGGVKGAPADDQKAGLGFGGQSVGRSAAQVRNARRLQKASK